MLSSDEEIPLQESSARYKLEFCDPSGQKRHSIFEKIVFQEETVRGNRDKVIDSERKMSQNRETSRVKHEKRGSTVLHRKKNMKTNELESSSSDDDIFPISSRKKRVNVLNESFDKLNDVSITNLLCQSDSEGCNSDTSDESTTVSKFDNSILSIQRSPKKVGQIVNKTRVLNNTKSDNHFERSVTSKEKIQVEQKAVGISPRCSKRNQLRSERSSNVDNCTTPSKKRKCVQSAEVHTKSFEVLRNQEENIVERQDDLSTKMLKDNKIVSTPDKKSSSVQTFKKVAIPITPTRRNKLREDKQSLAESKRITQVREKDLSEGCVTTPKKIRMCVQSPLKSPKGVNKKGNQDEGNYEGTGSPNVKHVISSSLINGEISEKLFTPERKPYSIQSLKKIATPTTPTNRKGTPKRLHLTPSMPVCKRNLSTPKTPLQDAMTRLHVSAVPCSLPCREDEFKNIFSFLQGKLLDAAGGCMYISGVPGTGKTATVREAVNKLQKMVQDSDLPDFQFIEINGMRLSHPRQAYVQLWKALRGEVVTPEQAQRLLENKFTSFSKKQTSIVILVDEVDVLWTRRQDVVYNLLDWPTKSKSRLVVVTIANTMDLPERLLMGRVTSRLGLTRLTFQPYTHKQLEEIVKARLEGLNAFDADAIQFVSRKVASLSGDARRALDICRRATEIAEQESPQNLVTIRHVDEALLSMTSSCTVQAIIQACSTLEQLFLQAVEADLARTGLEETTFNKAYCMMETVCSLEGLSLPTPKAAMSACMRLSSLRLLLSQHSHTDIYTRIILNISVDDLHYALQEIRKLQNNRK